MGEQIGDRLLKSEHIGLRDFDLRRVIFGAGDLEPSAPP